MANEEYQRGYDTALTDIYVALDSLDHPMNRCPCRACNTIREVVDNIFMRLGETLSDEDFKILCGIIGQLNK